MRASPPLLWQTYRQGFTLVEMAIVLMIFSLLVGGMMMSLRTQQEIARVKESERRLSEIRDALLGFAAANGRLPCPDTDSDPAAAGYGEEEASCSAAPAAEGFLPWKTLGVSALDAWGSTRTSSTSPRIGDWRYRVDRHFTQAFTLATGFSDDNLAVQDGSGNTLTSTAQRPIAIIFSAGPNIAADGQNASFESASGIYQAGEGNATFDDITIWLSRPTVHNRMITAGKLP